MLNIGTVLLPDVSGVILCLKPPLLADFFGRPTVCALDGTGDVWSRSSSERACSTPASVPSESESSPESPELESAKDNYINDSNFQSYEYQ